MIEVLGDFPQSSRKMFEKCLGLLVIASFQTFSNPLHDSLKIETSLLTILIQDEGLNVPLLTGAAHWWQHA
jgi:hypothetical protein